MPEFKLKCVLQPDRKRIADEVSKHLSAFGEDGRLFFSVPVSLFLDPDRQDSELLKTLCFYCCVPILVGTKGPHATACLAIVFCHDADAEHLLQVLNASGFPCVVLNSSESSDQIDRAIRLAIVERGGHANSSREFISKQQHVFSSNLSGRFRELVEEGWLDVFEEIAIRAAIDLMSWEECAAIRCGRLATPGYPGKDKERFELSDYGNKSSFDFMVTYPFPNSLPILAIEFDGWHHKQPRNVHIDKKKDKLCETAGLPLLRVTAEFLEYASSNSANIYAMHRKIRGDFVEFLIIQFFVDAGAWHRLQKARDSTPAQYRRDDQSLIRAGIEDLSPGWFQNNEQNRESRMLAEEFKDLTGRDLEVRFDRHLARGFQSSAGIDRQNGGMMRWETPWIDLKMVGHALLQPEKLLEEFGKVYLLKQAIGAVRAARK